MVGLWQPAKKAVGLTVASVLPNANAFSSAGTEGGEGGVQEDTGELALPPQSSEETNNTAVLVKDKRQEQLIKEHEAKKRREAADNEAKLREEIERKVRLQLEEDEAEREQFEKRKRERKTECQEATQSYERKNGIKKSPMFSTFFGRRDQQSLNEDRSKPTDHRGAALKALSPTVAHETSASPSTAEKKQFGSGLFGGCMTRHDETNSDLKSPHAKEPLTKRIFASVDNLFNLPSKFVLNPDTSSSLSKRYASTSNLSAMNQPLKREQFSTLLYNTTNAEEHIQQTKRMVEIMADFRGEKGLHAVGFEYRVIKCSSHVDATVDTFAVTDGANTADSDCAESKGTPDIESHMQDSNGPDLNNSDRSEIIEQKATDPLKDSVTEDDAQTEVRKITAEGASLENRDSLTPASEAAGNLHQDASNAGHSGEHDDTQNTDESQLQSTMSSKDIEFCLDCHSRLFHIKTDTMITEENRKMYVADGDMYEEMARLSQEYAQDLMRKEGHLEWLTICDDRTKGEPIRALVDRDHHILAMARPRDAKIGPGSSDNHHDAKRGENSQPKKKATLLITTGKGKVRAGIFSRQHLLTSSIESSTALPMVKEARRRGMKVTILDPNAREDIHGMATYETSVQALFGGQKNGNDISSSPTVKGSDEHLLFVLAHSASGAQLVRYLMDQPEPMIPRIRAIAFTDSTHNIQWVKNDSKLTSLLESDKSLYVRSSNVRYDDEWETRQAGEVAETDNFWQHRFGVIRTVWAGTKEHSLTNWAAHSPIWDHFDQQHNKHHTPCNNNEKDEPPGFEEEGRMDQCRRRSHKPMTI